MSKRTITITELKEKADHLFKENYKDNPRNRTYRYITFEFWKQPYEERDKQAPWKGEYEIMPLFVIDERWICGYECGYGADWVVDLVKNQFYIGTKGVFTDDFCFLGDYYGFPDGKFYLAHEQR